MLCQCCKENSATIHMTEISHGQRMETHLCEQCAQKQGLAVKNQIPLNELLSTLLSVQSQTSDKPAAEAPESNVACPSCGMTLKRFKKESLLGCPQDYEVFGDPLNGLIKKAHNGNETHHGKVPQSTPEDTRKQVKLAQLKQQLDQAVKREEYETAARLRDEIEKLK